MKDEVKTQVAAALRSGKYKQGDGRLRQRNKATGEECHCFMGVVADVVDPEGWEGPDAFGQYTHRGCGGALLDEALELAGMTDPEQWELIDRNDSEGVEFSAFADELDASGKSPA